MWVLFFQCAEQDKPIKNILFKTKFCILTIWLKMFWLFSVLNSVSRQLSLKTHTHRPAGQFLLHCLLTSSNTTPLVHSHFASHHTTISNKHEIISVYHLFCLANTNTNDDSRDDITDVWEEDCSSGCCWLSPDWGWGGGEGRWWQASGPSQPALFQRYNRMLNYISNNLNYWTKSATEWELL